MTIALHPIGRVVGGRAEPVDDAWATVEATIELDPEVVGPDATRGLDQFSHVEVVYLFHGVEPAAVTLGVRHPRGRRDWPEVGILAQRARARPNRLGVTVCELLAVRGLHLDVRGLDAIHGSPVLDVKPYFREFAPRGPVRQPSWTSELMAAYW